MKKILLISTTCALILFTGCNSANNTDTNSVINKAVSVTGIRKAGLEKDSQNLPVVTYNSQAPIPGKVKLYKKSFVTAPPMIPHSIAGMTPITTKNNTCLNCHLPQNAEAFGVVPIPKDHFVDNFKNNKKIRRIAGSRYFCTTCHTPQANVNPIIENKFKSIKSNPGLKSIIDIKNK